MTNLYTGASSTSETSLNRFNKNNKYLSRNLKNDSKGLPSPRLNKRYRYSILPSVTTKILLSQNML